jgi:hypothetical protein
MVTTERAEPAHGEGDEGEAKRGDPHPLPPCARSRMPGPLQIFRARFSGSRVRYWSRAVITGVTPGTRRHQLADCERGRRESLGEALEEGERGAPARPPGAGGGRARSARPAPPAPAPLCDDTAGTGPFPTPKFCTFPPLIKVAHLRSHN